MLEVSTLDRAAQVVAGAARSLGGWAFRRRFWTLYGLVLLVVLVKSGFRWGGQTGNGWFVEYGDIIQAWPLKEDVVVTTNAVFQENYAPIALFKVLVAVGAPNSSATWMALHIVATLAVLAVLGLWARRVWGDAYGRLPLVLIAFGAVPLILLHEIGRYDSFFFLGCALVIYARRWPLLLLGALLAGTSAWTMGLSVAVGVLLCAAVVRSRWLAVRGGAVLLGCVVSVVALMVLRMSLGGNASVGRQETIVPGQQNGLAYYVYLAWWNVIQPFPNWIWAALGVTWLLFALVVLQYRRRRALLAVAIICVPLAAEVLAGADGTRDIALSLTAVLMAVATTTQSRVAEGTETAVRPDGWSPLVFGLVLVGCVVAPVINIFPHQVVNPYGWLGEYGLSVVYGILGP